MRILHLDIETSPNQVYCWGLFKQNIGLNQIVNSGTTLCWSAKWHGEDKIMYSSIYHESRSRMLRKIHALLEEADAVVHYNGVKFDIPTLNKEFVLSRMTPPSSYRQIDLYTTVRSQFRFTSNKLDYVAKELGLGSKTQHKGMELWTQCMAFVDDAWNTMRTYNKQDVVLTEKLYNRLLPWIKNHPNVALYTDGSEVVCRTCAGTHLNRRGFQFTNASKFQRYRCMDCGSWMRARLNEADRTNLLLNV